MGVIVLMAIYFAAISGISEGLGHLLAAATGLPFSVGFGVIKSLLLSFGGLFTTAAFVRWMVDSEAAFRRGQVYGSLTTAQTDRDPQAPTIIYLRPFALDNVLVRRPRNRSGHPTAKSEVELLADAFRPIGQVRALIDPSVELPPIGPTAADRPDQRWQNTVLDEIDRARLVLMGVGSGEGFLWEVEQAIRHTRADQLVLIVPFDGAAYERFRAEAGHHFPRGLPPYAGRRPRDRATNAIAGAVYFELDWSPRPVWFGNHPADMSRLSRSTFDSFVACCHYWLRSVYERLDVRLPPIWRIPVLPIRGRRLYFVTGSQKVEFLVDVALVVAAGAFAALEFWLIVRGQG